ncbi:hypothetical protein DGG96_18330 [Legionella qingyii]|uniref:Uncharacterized protein n=1 Tax=Legionella qingyii TaxID=2184757 RepID=A0A317U1B6_9GAMM|nr:hypothetical protein [Legionella qingyii]PWY54170.1 hypothetical protein DGG96_18330 [Legionella qingyii]RUR23590.1 hypothetical protein ELY16_13080 [Legionella qingyii]RUR24069.1 hypothetical protein ELY20_05760 [Legionella qingyii]
MFFTNNLNKENELNAQGRVYYRSDKRPPEFIFKEGFSPRIKEFEADWWREAIQYRGYDNDRGINNRAVDADPAVCVCMSTKFESAAIFPLNNDDTYIYAIALPDLTQIEYVGSKGEVSLSKNPNTPADNKEIVVDLNGLQTVQARNINEFFNFSMPVSAGWPLYAYEALAYRVLPRSVICAIKCTRKEVEEEFNNSDLNLTKYLDKKIILTGPVIKNLNFCEAQLMRIGSANQVSLKLMDYGPQKIQAIQHITELKQKNELQTPNIYYGLGGKTF